MGSLVHNILTAPLFTATLQTGTLSMPLHNGRILSGGAYAATTGSFLTAATTPPINIVTNTHRITWAATSVVEVSWQVDAPADFDPAQSATVHLIASMSGATDTTAVVGVKFTQGIIATDRGVNTGVVASGGGGGTPGALTVTTAAGVLTGGNQWTITLTPGAHGTDALRVDALWITYNRI